jgi:hypothetical protein
VIDLRQRRGTKHLFVSPGISGVCSPRFQPHTYTDTRVRKHTHAHERTPAQLTCIPRRAPRGVLLPAAGARAPHKFMCDGLAEVAACAIHLRRVHQEHVTILERLRGVAVARRGGKRGRRNARQAQHGATQQPVANMSCTASATEMKP